MIAGILTIEAHIPCAVSLKDKRRVLQSVKKILRNRFNVSVAEVEYQDLWQRTRLAVAAVSNDRDIIENELRACLESVTSRPELDVTSQRIEYL